MNEQKGWNKEMEEDTKRTLDNTIKSGEIVFFGKKEKGKIEIIPKESVKEIYQQVAKRRNRK